MKNERGVPSGTYGGDERCTQVLVGRPEEKRPLGRHGPRWEDDDDDDNNNNNNNNIQKLI